MAEFVRRSQPPQAGLTLAGRIRRQLFIGLLVSSLVVAGAVALGLLAYLDTDRAYSQAFDQTGFIQDRVTRLNDAIGEEVLHTRAYLISRDEQSITSRDLARRDFEREYADLQEVLDRLSDASQLSLQKLVAAHADYDALAEEMIALSRSGEAEAVVDLFNLRSDPLVLELLTARRDLLTSIQAALIQANRDFSTRTGQIVILVAIVFLVGAIASSWLVTRLLASTLHALDYFEHALIETVQHGSINPLRLPMAVGNRQSPIFQAYNSLIARLQESEARRLDFVEAAAHELRSPLGSILGYAEMVGDPALRQAEADLQNYGRIIFTQAQRIGQMVDNLLSAAAIDENGLALILVPLPLGAVLAEVVEEARRHSGREITLENDLDAALIQGDPLHLRKIFSNLIDNALKFSAPDRPVHLCARRAPASSWVEVSVTDRGIGIAEADMPLLFRRFGRITNNQTQGIPGTGLGLYIVKYLVQRHHGQVALQSQPGEGTTFVVRLPVAEGCPQQADFQDSGE